MRLLALLVCGLVGLQATSALAQQQGGGPEPARPFRGLFGGPPGDPDHRRSLDVNASVFESYDDDLTAAQNGTANPNLDVRQKPAGVYSGMSTGATYNHADPHFEFGLTGQTNARVYPSLNSYTLWDYQTGASFRAHREHDQLRGSGSVGYMPFFAFAPFAAAPVADRTDVGRPSVDPALSHQSAYLFASDVSYEHTMHSRSSFALAYNVRRVSYPEQGLLQTSQGPNVLFRDQVSRNMALRFGYGYQQLRTSSDGRLIRVHNIDVGTDYTRALGETRRTTMGFEVGSSLYNQDQRRDYRVNGGAWLRREIGRSWSATAHYHRGVGMLDGFAHPYFADTWSATGGGLFTRKLELRLNASYSIGDLQLVSQGGQFSTGNGSAMMRYAITRLLAVYGEYSVYRYHFERAADLPTGLPPMFLRQSVRSGLTLLLPLYR